VRGVRSFVPGTSVKNSIIRIYCVFNSQASSSDYSTNNSVYYLLNRTLKIFKASICAWKTLHVLNRNWSNKNWSQNKIILAVFKTLHFIRLLKIHELKLMLKQTVNKNNLVPCIRLEGASPMVWGDISNQFCLRRLWWYIWHLDIGCFLSGPTPAFCRCWTESRSQDRWDCTQWNEVLRPENNIIRNVWRTYIGVVSRAILCENWKFWMRIDCAQKYVIILEVHRLVC